MPLITSWSRAFPPPKTIGCLPVYRFIARRSQPPWIPRPFGQAQRVGNPRLR